MPKNRGGEAGGGGGGGDWSETGTFVRKPTTGWLHKDAELADGSYIRYKLTVRDSLFILLFFLFSFLSLSPSSVLWLCKDHRINEISTISS